MKQRVLRVGHPALARTTLFAEWRGMSVFWLIQAAADVPSDDRWLARVERETLEALRSPKRRRDWRLGRWTAKQAVARLAALSSEALDDLSYLVIGSQPNGAPVCRLDERAVPWPISISHSHDRGLCVIGPAEAAVGCDLERVEPRIDTFAREWFTPSEQAALAHRNAEERAQMVTLFWSAKESALKAIGAGLTVSTQDVTVTIDEPSPGGEWNPLRLNRLGEGEPMLGWWRSDDGDLITVVSEPALGSPVSLE